VPASSPAGDAEVVPVAAVEQPPVPAQPERVAVEPPAEIAAAPHPAEIAAAPQPAIEPPPPAPPAHAQSSVAAEIALLALERRLVEERAEREALARELAEARERIEGLSAHHDSAVERAQEIVELEGRLAVANARADAAVAHVTRLERELAEAQVASENARPIEVKPLPPRTARRQRTEQWDTRTRIAAIVVVAVALIVVLTIALTLF
jgi:hypothetical protein